jgi:hypothetical protein
MFDLRNAIDILQFAGQLTGRLDTVEVPVDHDRVRKGDPAVAAVNRASSI